MKIAVITGASSGIGKEFVKAIAADGGIDEIWAVARNVDNLEKLKSEVNFNIRTVSLDVSDRGAVAEYEKLLADEKPDVKWLVNSAGYGKFVSYAGLNVDQSIAMIDANCSGLVAMTLATLPYMKEGAKVVNLGSSSAFQPLPYQNIYGASKVFVRHYSRALNRELASRKILVTCVCPSWVKTDFFAVAKDNPAEKGASNFKGIVMPDKVVKQAMKDIKKGKDMSVCTLKTKIEHVGTKLLPQRVIMNIWLRQQKLK